MILGFFKLCIKLIFSVFIVIPIILFIVFGMFSIFVGAIAAAPCLLAGIALFGTILFIPVLFIIGFIKALIK